MSLRERAYIRSVYYAHTFCSRASALSTDAQSPPPSSSEHSASQATPSTSTARVVNLTEDARQQLDALCAEMDAERRKAPDMYDPATDKGVRCYSKEYMEALRQAIYLFAQPLITEPSVRGLEEVLFNKEPFVRESSARGGGGSGGRSGIHSSASIDKFQPGFARGIRSSGAIAAASGGRQGSRGVGNNMGGGSRTMGGVGSQSRPTIGPRGSQHGGGNNDWPAQGVIARTSTVQAIELKKAENAWKPTSTKMKDFSEEDKQKVVSIVGLYTHTNTCVCLLQLTTNKIRGLLNKLTPERYEELVIKVIADSRDPSGKTVTLVEGEWFTIYNDKYAKEIVRILFDMAVEQPTFCAVYRCEHFVNFAMNCCSAVTCAWHK